jgi:hypothetical protein
LPWVFFITFNVFMIDYKCIHVLTLVQTKKNTK